MARHRKPPSVHVVECDSQTELVVKIRASTTVWVVGDCELKLEPQQRSADLPAVIHAAERRSASLLFPLRLTDSRVERALRAMQAAPARAWSISELARVAGLSRAAFSRAFKRALSRSPKEFLTQLRLELASARLASSDASLAEIAMECGYASEFALSRAFKRRYGVAPGQYRRSLRPARAVLSPNTLLRAAA